MTATQAGRTKRVFVLAAALSLPLVLAAPAVWLVKRHTTELRSAEQLVRKEVHRLDDAIVEIADFDRLGQVLMTHNAILEALYADQSIMLRLLNALGTLPAGVQLTAATASRGEVALVGVASEPRLVSAALEALQAAGLDDVAISLRQPLDGTGPGEQFEILARYDGLSKHQDAAVRGPTHLLARAERVTPP